MFRRIFIMIMTTKIFLLFGLIEHVSSIQCYTCNGLGNHCPMPFNIEGGDESNDNESPDHNFDSDHACLSDHSFDPRTGKEKLILRGVKNCRELNIPNRRIHCCYKNYCNKHLPQLTFQPLANIMTGDTKFESSSQSYISSIILIIFSIIFQYFY